MFSFFTPGTSLGFVLTEHWWDYPGFEAWRFLNLAIFVGLIVFIAYRKKLGNIFRDRRDTIRRELVKAQEERDAAVAKLKEVEERLTKLDTEVAAIQERSKREAAEERERIARSTEIEIAKLSDQARRDIESAGKVAKHELRRYAAEQSVSLAEQVIRREMKPEDDARIINENIQELGGPAQ